MGSKVADSDDSHADHTAEENRHIFPSDKSSSCDKEP